MKRTMDITVTYLFYGGKLYTSQNRRLLLGSKLPVERSEDDEDSDEGVLWKEVIHEPKSETSIQELTDDDDVDVLVMTVKA